MSWEELRRMSREDEFSNPIPQPVAQTQPVAENCENTILFATKNKDKLVSSNTKPAVPATPAKVARLGQLDQSKQIEPTHREPFSESNIISKSKNQISGTDPNRNLNITVGATEAHIPDPNKQPIQSNYPQFPNCPIQI